MIYKNSFDNNQDIELLFGCTIPENANILFANYIAENYEGNAFVLLQINEKLYEVNASHCSCYGLEGQWDLEETSVEALEHRINKGQLSSLITEDELYSAVKIFMEYQTLQEKIGGKTKKKKIIKV